MRISKDPTGYGPTDKEKLQQTLENVGTFHGAHRRRIPEESIDSMIRTCLIMSCKPMNLRALFCASFREAWCGSSARCDCEGALSNRRPYFNRLIMKIIPLLILSLSIYAKAAETVTIDKVATNTQREGRLVLLDQGYIGSFTFTEGSYLVDERDKKKFEFTHANLNDRGLGNRFPKAQSIVVGIDSSDNRISYRSEATYAKKIPSLKDLMAFKTVADFEKVFGSFRGMTDCWGSLEEMHSSVGWMGFSLMDDGSIRVVDVFLWTVNRGKGWEIDHRRIGDGIFKPTGRIPRLEPQLIQEVEKAGTGQPATRPDSKSTGSDKPQPESEGRSR